jgi:hypothetical protein
MGGGRQKISYKLAIRIRFILKKKEFITIIIKKSLLKYFVMVFRREPLLKL